MRYFSRVRGFSQRIASLLPAIGLLLICWQADGSAADTEAKMAAEELKKLGLEPHGYTLSLPYSRQCAQVNESDNYDPRTLNISASRSR